MKLESKNNDKNSEGDKMNKYFAHLQIDFRNHRAGKIPFINKRGEITGCYDADFDTPVSFPENLSEEEKRKRLE